MEFGGLDRAWPNTLRLLPDADASINGLLARKDQTMKRKRHAEEQIIAILKEHEAGVKTVDLCRNHGISEASFYSWKAKYGGLEVSEAKRLKGLESENARLKKLLADAMLDNAALKDIDRFTRVVLMATAVINKDPARRDNRQ
jgi:putative transposase